MSTWWKARESSSKTIPPIKANVLVRFLLIAALEILNYFTMILPFIQGCGRQWNG